MASTLNDEDLSISLPSYDRDSSVERDRDRDRSHTRPRDRASSHSHPHQYQKQQPPTTTTAIPHRERDRASPYPRGHQGQYHVPTNPNANISMAPMHHDPTASPATLRDMQRLDQYTTVRILGEGSFGKVKLAVHRASGRQVALKIIPRRKLQSRDMVGRVEREIQYLQLLRHPHIIKL